MNAPNMNAPQPPPTAGTGEEVWPTIYDAPGLVLPDWLRADMRERHELGKARYGQPLRTWNGRDALVDAYQEALDLAVYTRQARLRVAAVATMSGPERVNLLFKLEMVTHQALQLALWIGELARSGAVPSMED